MLVKTPLIALLGIIETVTGNEFEQPFPLSPVKVYVVVIVGVTLIVVVLAPESQV